MDRQNRIVFLCVLALCLICFLFGAMIPMAKADPILPTAAVDPATLPGADGVTTYESFESIAGGVPSNIPIVNGTQLFAGTVGISGLGSSTMSIYSPNLAGASLAGGLNTANSFNNFDNTTGFQQVPDGGNNYLGISGTGAELNLTGVNFNQFSLFAGTLSNTPGPQPITLSFYDTSHLLLGTVTDLYDHTATGDGNLDSFGGYTAYGQQLGYVDITSPTGTIAIDGLQLSENPMMTTPAPSTLAMLLTGGVTFGAVWVVRRRKGRHVL